MYTQKIVTWGMAFSLALTLAAPAMAANNSTQIIHKSTGITVTEKRQDDTQAFRQWYGEQMRGYGDVDADTGERYSELVQVVVDISDNNIMVSDQQGLRRGVLINRRTEIVFTPKADQVTPFNRRKRPNDRQGMPLNSILQHGDFVIVQGYLRVGGGIVATNIRVVGHGRGYYDDNDNQGFDGERAWGDVRNVDARRGQLEIATNTGRRTVTVERNAQIIARRDRISLDAIQRGDRVVIYFRNERNYTIVDRVVLLADNDKYPNGDRPYWADPNGWDDDDRDSQELEGRFQSAYVGIFFNHFVMRGTNGREYTIRSSKGTQVIDRDGDRISIFDLRQGQQLQVQYSDIGGSLFAVRIEVE